MIAGIESVLIILILIGIGCFFSKKNFWPDGTSGALSAIVVKLAAPALALISISDGFTPTMLRESAVLMGIGIIYMSLMFVCAKLLSKILKLNGGKKIIFEINFIFANVTFIGLPITQISLGNDAIPYLFIIYIITLILFWTLGAYMIAHGSTESTDEERPFSIKKIFSPGLFAVIAGIILVEFQIELPFILYESISYISYICVPLSLLVIGSKLLPDRIRDLKPDISTVIIMIGKFVISPLLMYLLLTLFHIEGIAFKAMLLASTMPCHMQTSIMANHYDVESEYSSKMVSFSTLLCFITIPTYVTILQSINL